MSFSGGWTLGEWLQVDQVSINICPLQLLIVLFLFQVVPGSAAESCDVRVGDLLVQVWSILGCAGGAQLG